MSTTHGHTPDIDPKRSNLRARRTVFDLADGMYPAFAEPGLYELHEGVMMLACPGCGSVMPMCVGNPKPIVTPSWQLYGDVTRSPSLAPAVNCVGCCGWHGFLRGGVFDSI